MLLTNSDLHMVEYTVVHYITLTRVVKVNPQTQYKQYTSNFRTGFIFHIALNYKTNTFINFSFFVLVWEFSLHSAYKSLIRLSNDCLHIT